jgi:hypothetical protein
MTHHHAITSSIAYQRRIDLERQANQARLSRHLRRVARTASPPTRRLPAATGVAPRVATAT